MRINSSRIGAFIVGLIGILTIGILLWGQEPAPSLARISLPRDWSHRHIVFSNPSTVEQGMRVRQDPRFWQQYFRRKVPQTLPTAIRRSRIASAPTKFSLAARIAHPWIGSDGYDAGTANQALAIL